MKGIVQQEWNFENFISLAKKTKFMFKNLMEHV